MKTIRDPILSGYCFWCLWTILASACLFAQTHEPAKAGYLKNLIFRHTAGPKDVVVKPPAAVNLLIYKNLFDTPEVIPMKKNDSLWTANYVLSDTSVKMLFYAFRIQDDVGRVSTDDASGVLYDLLIYGTDGNPVRGAFETGALSYTGISDRREEKLDMAMACIQQELAYYPGNLSAKNLYYALLLKQSEYSDAARVKIKEDIRSTLVSRPNDEAVLQFAINAFRMIGETGQADRIEKELIRKNPKSDQAVQKTLSEILQIQNVRSRLDRLEQFRKDIPQSRMDEFALSQIVSASIEIEDMTRMIRTGDLLLQKASTPAGSNALAALAGIFADKKTELDRAQSYVQKALSIIQSSGVSVKPGELKDTEWRDQNLRTEARYRDVLGWVYLQKGNLEWAQVELGRAAEHTFQVNLFYHLGCLYEKSGNIQEALLNYGNAVAFGGKTAEQARGSFRKLWIKAGKDTLLSNGFLDEQHRWVEDKNRELILSKRISRPAPDFKLEDVSGGYVRLSGQRGNPVVLCFWAGWSQSSLLVLEDLQQMANAFGKDVLFITIFTDAEKPNLRKLPNNERLFLPVLIGKGIEREYGIQGVPMVYVIDKDGLIRFEHKGFRPDLIQVLSIELQDMLGK